MSMNMNLLKFGIIIMNLDDYKLTISYLFLITYIFVTHKTFVSNKSNNNNSIFNVLLLLY